MKQLYYDVKKCLACKSCEFACSLAHSTTGELFKSLREEVLSLPRQRILLSDKKNYPISCRNCADAKCVDACIAAALSFDREKGVINHDQERCIGCWMCVMVCPYNAIRSNKSKKVPLRCDKCKDKDEPACVKACPTGAIIWQEELTLK